MTHPNNSLTFFAYHFSATGEGLSLPTTGQPSGANSTAGWRGDCARTQTTEGGRGELLGSPGSPGSPDHVGSAAGPLVSAQSCPLVAVSGCTACTQAESTRRYWVSPAPSAAGKLRICLARVFSSYTSEETLREKEPALFQGRSLRRPHRVPPSPAKQELTSVPNSRAVFWAQGCQECKVLFAETRTRRLGIRYRSRNLSFSEYPRG